LTDGVATAGETEGKAIREAVRSLGNAGVTRLDVVAVGGLRDQAMLRQLVTGNLASDGQVIDGGVPLDEIARRLTRASRSGIEVSVTGAEWVWPQVLDGVQPGDEVLVYADLPAGKSLDVALDGRTVDLGGRQLARVRRPLLERAWVGTRIDRLLHLRDTRFADDRDVRRALQLEVTQLSVDHRVLSPYSAFLVLETERDYARYQLDRTALADILTVGAAGLEVVNRTPPRPSRPREKAKREEPRDAMEKIAEAVAEMVPIFDRIEVEAEFGEAEAGEAEFGEPERSLPAVSGATEAFARPEPAAAAPPPHERDDEVAEEVIVASAMEVEEDVEEDIGVDVGEDKDGTSPDPYGGRFAEVMRHLAGGRVGKALRLVE
ncbi:MAG: hypothetical protein GY856_43105, partial [bacterium]|nr:hypothetical protein [bacterium]